MASTGYKLIDHYMPLIVLCYFVVHQMILMAKDNEIETECTSTRATEVWFQEMLLL